MHPGKLDLRPHPEEAVRPEDSSSWRPGDPAEGGARTSDDVFLHHTWPLNAVHWTGFARWKCLTQFSLTSGFVAALGEAF